MPIIFQMGFESLVYLDWLSLQNDQSVLDETQALLLDSDTASKAVSLTILYFGLGLTLSW